jgi:hypothetical protein
MGIASLSPRDRSSKMGTILNHDESFALGSDHKPVVKADKIESRGPSFRGKEGGGELKGIGSAQGVDQTIGAGSSR